MAGAGHVIWTGAGAQGGMLSVFGRCLCGAVLTTPEQIKDHSAQEGAVIHGAMWQAYLRGARWKSPPRKRGRRSAQDRGIEPRITGLESA